MTERSVTVRLMANINDFRAKMQEAERVTDRYGKNIDGTSRRADTAMGRLVQSADQNREAWDRAGGTLAAFGAVTVGALALSAKAAIDWESQFAGVEKTVDGTAGQLNALEGSLRSMARELPASHREIAAVAEAAGQLGVETSSIAEFTRTMVDLGETTNLSADEAATSIAQMMNVMQTAPDQVDKFGSTLVALGNAGASTEKQIVEMAQRIAGAGAVVGATESDILAIANAVASMGIEVEAGGTSVSRVLTDMSKAVQTGGGDLAVFAKVAGVSAAEFSAAFEERPAEALAMFTEGLGEMKDSGENVFAVLDQIGLSDVRVSQALLGMASSGDLLRESLDLGAEAWSQNTALAVEASKRYETTASQLQVVKNNATDAAIGFGEVLLPAVGALAEGAKDLAGWLGSLDEGQKTAIVSTAGLAGGAAVLGGAFLLVFPRVMDAVGAFRDLRDISPGTATNLGKVGKAVGITAAALTALNIAYSSTAGNAMAQSASEATAALTRQGFAIEDLDEQIRNLQRGEKAESFDGLTAGLEKLANPNLINRMEDLTGEVLSLGADEGRRARNDLIEQLNAQGEALALLAGSGNAELAAEQFRMFEESAEAAGMPLEDLLDLMPAYRDALADLEVEKNLGGVARMSDEARAAVFGLNTQVEGIGIMAPQAKAALDGFESSMRLVGDTTGWSDEQLEAAEERLQEWRDAVQESFAGYATPLGVYQELLQEKTDAERAQAEESAENANDSVDDRIEAIRRNADAEIAAVEGSGAAAEATKAAIRDQRDATVESLEDSKTSWEDYAGAVEVSLTDYAESLEQSNANQEAWRENLVAIAGRGRDGVVEQLIAMGVEGADLTAALAASSEADFDRMADAMIAEAQFANEGSVDEFVTGAAAMEAIARDGGKSTVKALADELGLAVPELERIAREYSGALAGGINPLLDSLGRPKVSLGRGRTGNIQDRRLADGGIEDHRAHIAPAGTWRTFAEDETGGEAYIPLSPAKRARSMDIWRETGRRLQAPEVVENYAAGGFSSVSDIPKPRSTGKYGPPLSTAAGWTMGKGYDEVAEWVKDNSAMAVGLPGGPPPGSGASLVAIGRWIQSKGGRVSGHPAFGGVTPGAHSPTSLHYRNRAIDVNYGPGGANAQENRFVRGILPELRRMANFRQVYYREIGGRSDHDDHLHLGLNAGGIVDTAKGTLTNPHIRDGGGPLMPGYTFNGTGVPENTTVLAPGQRVHDASQAGAGAVHVTTSLDPASLVGALDGARMTLMVDGRPVQAIVRAELDADARALQMYQ